MDNDGKLIARTEELCNINNINNSSGKYYSCTSGLCTSTLKTSRDKIPNVEQESKWTKTIIINIKKINK